MQAIASSTLEWTGTPAAGVACFHCGTACGAGRADGGDKTFCCHGCKAVFELLGEAGLSRYYELGDGIRARATAEVSFETYAYLDAPAVRARLVDFDDGKQARATFRVPEIHCVACVWLLENLFRLRPGIGRCTVHFPRKQAVVQFDPGVVRLSEVAALLASVGYPPELRLSDMDKRPSDPVLRRMWLQTGVAGFAFGNTMLFSIALYLGLDAFSGPAFARMFGWLSMALSVPVVLFSARDYWKATWHALGQRAVTLDVPIAMGIVAIWFQSAWEVAAGRGHGYFDSLAGLLFFLNIGRVFQRKTFDRLSFDRDYRSFFPLAVTRRRGGADERVALSEVAVGDRLVVRHGELVPADSRLVEGPALMDYGFVTGEAEPVARTAGDVLHAGGRQLGGQIEVETIKAVSQGYLTDLWNQDVFQKQRDDTFGTWTNRFGRRFTWIVLVVALASAAAWAPFDPARGVKAFISVLIVACPCALALAAPFALGTAVRILAGNRVFLRNPEVIEALARIDTVVFDKTGTLTSAEAGELEWHGPLLAPAHVAAIRAVAAQSTHPLSRRIVAGLGQDGPAMGVEGFEEAEGCGVRGLVDGVEWRMGSAAWLARDGVEVPSSSRPGSRVVVVAGGAYAGEFTAGGCLREAAPRLLANLRRAGYGLGLLSGDNDRERARLEPLFGPGDDLRFGQAAMDKLGVVRSLQEAGRSVLMAGDGLNDAGAMRQADVGVAVVEDIAAFSPASDVILPGGELGRLASVLAYARRVAGVVRASFAVSSAYNVVGLAIAAAGWLSPVVCAVLMPLSSVTVVLVACGLAARAARLEQLGRPPFPCAPNPGPAIP